jgi:hypothetical protein
MRWLKNNVKQRKGVHMNTKMYNYGMPMPTFTPSITVKQYAEKQFAQNCYKVCFEHNGQSINNPWIDDTGRFEFDTKNAVNHYGVINVLKFYLTVFNRIPGIAADDKDFYESDWFIIVNTAYRENNQEAIDLINAEEYVAGMIYDYGTFVGLDTIGQWDVMSQYDVEEYASTTDDDIVRHIDDYIDR